MKKKCFLFVSVVFVCFSLGKCDITINGSRCNQRVCKRDEYCQPLHGGCESCKGICNEKTHNFDSTLCVEKCQDFLHDSRYVLKEDGSSEQGTADLRATVQRLSRMVTGILTLVCFMLLVLATVLSIQLYRWKKKKNITISSLKNKIFSKKSDSNVNKNTTISNKMTEKPDLRLEMPTIPSSVSDHSPVTVSTSISRRPAEDSTLDYAYDNPAMNSSPTIKASDRF